MNTCPAPSPVDVFKLLMELRSTVKSRAPRRATRAWGNAISAARRRIVHFCEFAKLKGSKVEAAGRRLLPVHPLAPHGRHAGRPP
jgi:hypothetical protein